MRHTHRRESCLRQGRGQPKLATAAMIALGTAAGPTRADTDALGEVIVLAQKRPAELQQVARSLTAIGADDIAAQGIQGLADVAAQSPMLDMQESVTAATSTLRIRGIGNLGNIPTFEPSVALFVDGAFRSRSLFAAGPLLDVERIEILRGPQTALYGKNSGAGVVAVYTQEPPARLETVAEAAIGLLDAPGEPALARFRAGIGGPLGAATRGSVAVAGSWQGEAAENALPGGPDGNGPDEVAARGQLLWSRGERLAVRLIGSILKRDGHEGESDVVFVPGARSTQILESLQAQGLTGACPDNTPHNRVSCSVATNRLDLDAAEATLIADYRLANGWLLHSLTGYERYRDRRDEHDAVQLLAPLLFFHDSEKSESIQEELRLSSAADARAPWLAGLFWYAAEYERGTRGRRPMFGPNGDLAFDPFWTAALGIPLAVPGQQGLHDSRLETDHLGVFGQVVLPFGDRFDVTADARWAREEKRARIANAVTAPGDSVISRVLTPATTPAGEPVNGSTGRESDDFTWSLTPQFRVDDGRMLYATWARGGKFGGFNTGFGNAPLAAREFGDEKIDHLEAGARFRFAGGRGRLGASAFRTRYHDYQDAAFIGAQFTVGNVGRLDLDGAELEAEYRFESGMSASLAVAWADVTYGRNTTGMCAPGRAPDGTLPGACDLSGESPVDAAPWSAQIGVEQAFALGGADASLRFDWSWTDAYNTSFSADPRLIQPDFHDLALRFGVRLGPSVELVFAGENLLDETVVHFDSVLNFFNDGSFQSFVAPPRRYSLTLRVRR